VEEPKGFLEQVGAFLGGYVVLPALGLLIIVLCYLRLAPPWSYIGYGAGGTVFGLSVATMFIPKGKQAPAFVGLIYVLALLTCVVLYFVAKHFPAR
jgi:hypothetical protein